MENSQFTGTIYSLNRLYSVVITYCRAPILQTGGLKKNVDTLLCQDNSYMRLWLGSSLEPPVHESGALTTVSHFLLNNMEISEQLKTFRFLFGSAFIFFGSVVFGLGLIHCRSISTVFGIRLLQSSQILLTLGYRNTYIDTWQP